MPPTLAAAKNTTCGRLAANHLFTAAWSRKSTSLRGTVSGSTFSRTSRRIRADPTIPRWPATKTRLPSNSNGILAIGNLPFGHQEVRCHHFLDELGERGLRRPAQFFARLAGIADQQIDLGRAEVYGVNAHHG